jgi:predicted DNA-binding protein
MGLYGDLCDSLGSPLKTAPKTSPRQANLVARISPAAKAALEQLAERSGQTQAAIVDRLILAAVENSDRYYLRSAAINAFTAAALARVILGVVAADYPQLTAALGVVDGVSRGLFGEVPPPPEDALGMDEADPGVALVLGAFGLLDPQQ